MPDSLDPQVSAPSAPTPPAAPAVGPIAQVLLDHQAKLLAQLKPLTPGLRAHQPGEINAGIKRLCNWLREHALGLAPLPGLYAPQYAPMLFDGAPALDPPAQALLEAWADTLRRHASGKSQARLHKAYKAVRQGGDRAAQLSAKHHIERDRAGRWAVAGLDWRRTRPPSRDPFGSTTHAGPSCSAWAAHGSRTSSTGRSNRSAQKNPDAKSGSRG